MNTPKPSRRKGSSQKLEPIDWHEYANDAVLQGNMSTLYQRPASEDPSAYASPEALVEIGKRVSLNPTVGVTPTVGSNPAGGSEPTEDTIPPVAAAPPEAASPTPEPTVGPLPAVGIPPTERSAPAMGAKPTVGLERTQRPAVRPKPTVGIRPTVGIYQTVGTLPTVGIVYRKKVKPIRDLQDALTLAGHVLYRAMYGVAEGSGPRSCTKGYRQLAAETRLDKDTVRDLIYEFKEKGILRETGTYDPDTRSSKTYEILSPAAVLQMWRAAGVQFVTAGRQRPAFCTAQGEALGFVPTVGLAEPV